VTASVVLMEVQKTKRATAGLIKDITIINVGGNIL
jgi:hypothetical protein